jgi:drug/metabolite transporter (DMT)-like permease
MNNPAIRPLGPTSLSLVMLTSALWGGTPVAISYAVVSLPPVAVAAVRFALAAVFMLVWCRFEGSSLRLGKGQLKLSLVAAFLLFVQISTFNLGVAWSNSSHASLLINTFVFWVVAIEHFFTKTDRMTMRKLMGLVIAALGAVIILFLASDTAALPDSLDDLPTSAGDIVLLVSAFLLGIKIVFVKQALKQVEPGKLIFWHDVFAVVQFTAYSAVAEEVALEQVTIPAALALIYQGILVAGLCFAIQAQLLRKHTASQISIFSFTTPLFGVILAAAFRNDPLSPWLLISVAGVAVGIFLVNTGQRG